MGAKPATGGSFLGRDQSYLGRLSRIAERACAYSRHVLVDVENTGDLARLPVDRLVRDAKGSDRSSIFKIPLLIESIHLRHRRFDFVGLRRPSGLQAFEQTYDRVRIDHIPSMGLIQSPLRSSASHAGIELESASGYLGRPAAMA
jgi:hypothetical protein